MVSTTGGDTGNSTLGGSDLAPLEFLGRLRIVDGQPVPPPGSPRVVTKHRVRQALAYVSARYPQARPTRGNLKQVLHFFDHLGGHSPEGDNRSKRP